MSNELKNAKARKYFADSRASERRIESLIRSRIAKRTCLSCDELFQSSWVGNRLCPNCKPESHDE